MSVLLPGVVLVAILAFTPVGRSLVLSMVDLSRPQYTVEDRLNEFGPSSRERWRGRFAPLGLEYAPTSVMLVAFKDERLLEVHVRGRASSDPTAPWIRVASFPILGASGVAGPKLREGDLQVPEGIYRVESLNPNSRFHASLRLDYPNEFDRSMASRDGRAAQGVPLGGDVMIHGGDQSVGCLAIGDEAVEQIFTLVADTGVDGVRVVIAPWDLRVRAAPEPTAVDPAASTWSPELYRAIQRVLDAVPKATDAGQNSQL